MGVLAALAFGALARGLPAETFFVGDPGVKLIAARHAVAHPSAPLDIPLPSLGGEPAPFVEPFFIVHGDHMHAVTSEVFPLVSAPFIALIGIRGAYVLPAIGFFLALGGSVAIGRALDRGRSASAVLLAAALGTPFLFYGFEFWEHAPAVGIAALATAIWLGHRTFWAGMLFGIAVLLRPEALGYVVAVGAASTLQSSRPSAAELTTAALGLAVAVLPLEIYSLVHFQSVLPLHIGAHSELLTANWFATRATIARSWFVPTGFDIPDWWGLALLLIPLAALVTRPNRDGRRFLVAVTLLDCAFVVLAAPNDGGGQWGPRYLLFAYVPAAVLLADVASGVTSQRIARTAIVVLLIGMGAWAQRDGYRRLRNTKLIYGHVLDFVRREVPANGTIVTDLWWLDQVAAAATEDRRLLYTQDQGASIIGRLNTEGVPRVTIFRSLDESSAANSWIDGSCYVVQRQVEILERRLVATTLERGPACP